MLRPLAPLFSAALVVAAAGSPALAATHPPSRFGSQYLLNNMYAETLATGIESYTIVGNPVTWSKLMPDGFTVNETQLYGLDDHIRWAMDGGMKAVVLRVVPGGGPAFPFSGPSEAWPVDPNTYDSKEGEYLGPQATFTLLKHWSYPPRELTRDEPGDTTPWYEFVYALAKRYDGTTPDPRRPGQLLPKVDHYQCIEEPEEKTFWYGTTKEYFGGVGGDPEVGVLPTFYRAVHAANPDAVVAGGGLTSHEAGHYIAYQKAVAAGNLYTNEVRAWAREFFDTEPIAAWVYDAWPDNPELLFQHFDTDLDATRARLFFEALFAASAHYDVIAGHFYDNWKMMDEVLAMYTANTPGNPPFWLTELGLANSPGLGQPGVSQQEHAYRVIKGIATALALGIEHVAYFPMMSFTGFMPLYNGTTPTQARAAFQVMATRLNDVGGYSFAHRFQQSGVLATVFSEDAGPGHMATIWKDDGTTSVFANALLGIPGDVAATVLDYQGQVVFEGTLDAPIDVGRAPLIVLWDDDQAPACNVSSRGGARWIDGALFLMALWLVRAPARRTRRCRPGR